jgi:hypothetical protein
MGRWIFINAAAARGPTSGIDTSNLNADIFAHPENYTGAQKAADLQQLLDTQNKLNLGWANQITEQARKYQTASIRT